MKNAVNSLISSAAPTVQNTYTYFAEATYEGLATPVTGSFNNTSNPTEFGIALAAGKTWTITCGIKNAADDIVLSDSQQPLKSIATLWHYPHCKNLRMACERRGIQ